MKLSARINIFYILMAILGASAVVFAQEGAGRTLTLKESLQLARERDIRVILSQERVTQALARLGQNRSTLLPQININASQRRQTRDLRSSGLDLPGSPLIGPFNTFDARGEFMQTIFDPAVMARFRSAQAGHEFSVAELRKTKEDVLALVAAMYINARRSSQSVDYAKAMVARDEKKLNIIKARLETGMSSLLDAKQSQAEFDSAISFLQQAQTDAVSARSDLLAALGLDLDAPVVFSDDNGIDFPSPGQEATPTDWEQLPDMQVARQQLSVSQMNRAAERSERLPKISGSADYGPSGLSPQDSSETYGFGVQASLPIFDGGLRASRIKEADSQVKASEAELHDTRYQVEANIIKAKESFQYAQKLSQQKISERAVAAAQSALIQQQYKDGTASELELLETAAQEAMARDQENEAQAGVVIAQINWVRHLGNLETFIQGVK